MTDAIRLLAETSHPGSKGNHPARRKGQMKQTTGSSENLKSSEVKNKPGKQTLEANTKSNPVSEVNLVFSMTGIKQERKETEKKTETRVAKWDLEETPLVPAENKRKWPWESPIWDQSKNQQSERALESMVRSNPRRPRKLCKCGKAKDVILILKDLCECDPMSLKRIDLVKMYDDYKKAQKKRAEAQQHRLSKKGQKEKQEVEEKKPVLEKAEEYPFFMGGPVKMEPEKEVPDTEEVEEKEPEPKKKAEKKKREKKKREKKKPEKEPEKEPEKKPEKEPEKKPEKEPEKKPEKEPEKKPEKEPENKPEKEPEKKPEKEPEKEPEKKPEKEPETKKPRKMKEKPPVKEPVEKPENKESLVSLFKSEMTTSSNLALTPEQLDKINLGNPDKLKG